VEGALHPLVGGFSDAETYDRGRPVHDLAVARALTEPLGLRGGSPVLELGAGTGQLSRALLELGLQLTAVEPLGPTRDMLARAIGEENVRAGVAEDIPMEDASVDAVLVADAFHWFDEKRTMPEIRRVLRPDGGVAIMRTSPSWDFPWAGELGELVADLHANAGHPALDGRPAAAALEEDPAFGPVTATTASSQRTADRDLLVAYMASVSWIATLTPERRSEVLRSVGELLDRHGVQELTFGQVHQIWTAKLL
jgi:SAM-dependent methyltransferase